MSEVKVKNNTIQIGKHFSVTFQRTPQLPEAQYMLGIMYAKGWGVEKNSNLSLYWIRQAADNGYAIARRMLEGLFGKRD
jgi:TPR repeat protein